MQNRKVKRSAELKMFNNFAFLDCLVLNAALDIWLKIEEAGTWLSVLNHFPSSDPASLDQVSHWKPDPPASFRSRC